MLKKSQPVMSTKTAEIGWGGGKIIPIHIKVHTNLGHVCRYIIFLIISKIISLIEHFFSNQYTVNKFYEIPGFVVTKPSWDWDLDWVNSRPGRIL